MENKEQDLKREQKTNSDINSEFSFFSRENLSGLDYSSEFNFFSGEEFNDGLNSTGNLSVFGSEGFFGGNQNENILNEKPVSNEEDTIKSAESISDKELELPQDSLNRESLLAGEVEEIEIEKEIDIEIKTEEIFKKEEEIAEVILESEKEEVVVEVIPESEKEEEITKVILESNEIEENKAVNLNIKISKPVIDDDDFDFVFVNDTDEIENKVTSILNEQTLRVANSVTKDEISETEEDSVGESEKEDMGILPLEKRIFNYNMIFGDDDEDTTYSEERKEDVIKQVNEMEQVEEKVEEILSKSGIPDEDDIKEVLNLFDNVQSYDKLNEYEEPKPVYQEEIKEEKSVYEEVKEEEKIKEEEPVYKEEVKEEKIKEEEPVYKEEVKEEKIKEEEPVYKEEVKEEKIKEEEPVYKEEVKEEKIKEEEPVYKEEVKEEKIKEEEPVYKEEVKEEKIKEEEPVYTKPDKKINNNEKMGIASDVEDIKLKLAAELKEELRRQLKEELKKELDAERERILKEDNLQRQIMQEKEEKKVANIPVEEEVKYPENIIPVNNVTHQDVKAEEQALSYTQTPDTSRVENYSEGESDYIDTGINNYNNKKGNTAAQKNDDIRYKATENTQLKHFYYGDADKKKDEKEDEFKDPIKLTNDTMKKVKTVPKKIIVKRIFRTVILNGIIYLVILFACIFFIPRYVVQRTVVSGESMELTLMPEDNLLVEKLSYRFSDPKRFDVIVFYPYGRDSSEYYVKRVIGLPGETVQIKGNSIYVDGIELKEDYGKEPIKFAGIAKEPLKLGEDEYFVMGDNRTVSLDSRYEDVGPVHRDLIEGHVLFRIWPLNHIGKVE